MEKIKDVKNKWKCIHTHTHTHARGALDWEDYIL